LKETFFELKESEEEERKKVLVAPSLLFFTFLTFFTSSFKKKTGIDGNRARVERPLMCFFWAGWLLRITQLERKE